MGNMNYLHHRQLRAPMADVHELTNLLRQLDFKVVSLLDLNWQEMNSAVTEFLLLLDRGVYGEFFFSYVESVITRVICSALSLCCRGTVSFGVRNNSGEGDTIKLLLLQYM